MSSSSEQGPHPLAQRLIARAADDTLAGPVLEVGTGSGRNTRALVDAGIAVVSVPDETPYTQLPGTHENYGAALATHAYLHGASDKVRAGLAELRRVLRRGAPVFLTLGSLRDARYGLGIRFDDRWDGRHLDDPGATNRFVYGRLFGGPTAYEMGQRSHA